MAPDWLDTNDPGPRCDGNALLGTGGLPELELLLLECELFELDFLTCIALLCVWTCSGVDDEIWYELDVFDSSIGVFITSVTSLIRGILDKDSVTKCQPNKLLCKIIEGLNIKNNKQPDQLSFAKDHTK